MQSQSVFPFCSCVYSPTFSPHIFRAAVIVAHSVPSEISIGTRHLDAFQTLPHVSVPFYQITNAFDDLSHAVFVFFTMSVLLKPLVNL